MHMPSQSCSMLCMGMMAFGHAAHAQHTALYLGRGTAPECRPWSFLLRFLCMGRQKSCSTPPAHGMSGILENPSA